MLLVERQILKSKKHVKERVGITEVSSKARLTVDDDLDERNKINNTCKALHVCVT